MELIKTAENLRYVSSHVTLYVNPLQEECQFQDAAEEQRVERNLPSDAFVCVLRRSTIESRAEKHFSTVAQLQPNM